MTALAAFLLLPLLDRKRKRKLPTLVAALLCVAALRFGLTGCANVFHSIDLVAPGAYTIPITAVDAASGITHTASMTLKVTP